MRRYEANDVSQFVERHLRRDDANRLIEELKRRQLSDGTVHSAVVSELLNPHALGQLFFSSYDSAEENSAAEDELEARRKDPPHIVALRNVGDAVSVDAHIAFARVRGASVHYVRAGTYLMPGEADRVILLLRKQPCYSRLPDAPKICLQLAHLISHIKRVTGATRLTAS